MFILFTYLLYIFKTIAIFVKRNCGCFAQGGMAEHGLHVVRFFVSACVMLRPFATARPPAGVWGRARRPCAAISVRAVIRGCRLCGGEKYNLYGYGEKKVAKDVSRMRQRAARKVDVLPCVRYADRGRLHAAAVDASDRGGAAVCCRFRHVQRLAQGDGRAHGCELPVCAQPSGRDNRGVAACGRSRHVGRVIVEMTEYAWCRSLQRRNPDKQANK